MLSDLLVSFYRFWHGKLHLKGSGLLLRRCAQRLPGFENYRLKVPNLGLITVNLNDASGIWWLNYSLGERPGEEGMISAIRKLSPRHPVIWDIGANAGFFAAALVQSLKDYAEIRLFEPNPSFNSILREFGSLAKNVFSHNISFSDQPGTATLYVPKGDSTIASFSKTPGSIPVHVECTTGDLFLKESGAKDPDVVIIDTEGNDCRVIKGFGELIERKRPLIFFENLFETEERINATLPAGYFHFTVDDRSGEPVPGLDKTRGHNSVFVPQTDLK